eukprot:GHVN01092284.1.p2 GENE.GHVN01092284.1~~GHVN01092284.1.p2  ORF type:complete len:106 (-),score=23.77 GHVN01092284.1:867-1184(-)
MEQRVCVFEVYPEMFKQHEELIVFPTNAKVVCINIRNKEGDEELTALTTKQLQVKGSSHSSPVVLNFSDAKSTVVPVAAIASSELSTTSNETIVAVSHKQLSVFT